MPKLTDVSRLCLHTFTTKPWTLREAIENYTAEEIPAITVWREHYEDIGPAEAAKMLKDSPLKIASVCRGGFFPATSGMAREEARTKNRRIIDEAVTLGAPLVVLVCGACPDIPLAESRQHILDGIVAILPHAKEAGVKLAIEPLHPMYAADRSAINTLEQAVNIVTAMPSPYLGIAVDVYHLWWDPYLRAEIERAGKNIFAFHVSDWRIPTRDLLLDRGLMGEGCIDIPQIRAWVEKAGFTGWIEVEIFSEEFWAQDQRQFLHQIKHAYLNHV